MQRTSSYPRSVPEGFLSFVQVPAALNRPRVLWVAVGAYPPW